MSATDRQGLSIPAAVRTHYVEASCALGVAISRLRDRLGADRGDRVFQVAAVAVPGTALLAWLVRSNGHHIV